MSNRSEAEDALATAQAAAEEARSAYQAAIDRGDMESASQSQKAAQRADADAERWADRIAVIDAEKAQADQRRADKRLAEAVAAAEQAAEAESAAHRELAAAVAKLREVRKRLDVVHEDMSRAAMAAQRMAADAGRPAPKIARSDLHRMSEPRELLGLAKALASVANSQSRSVVQINERARRTG